MMHSLASIFFILLISNSQVHANSWLNWNLWALTAQKCNSSSFPDVDAYCRNRLDCTSVNGVADDTCAFGLGVCCAQIVVGGGQVITNLTSIANPSYPDNDTEPSFQQWQISINPGVKQVELRMEEFELSPVCSQDRAQLTGTSDDSRSPIFCGSQTGESFWYSVTPPPDTTLIQSFFAKTPGTFLTFSVTTTGNFPRSYRIKVVQYTTTQVPNGCFLYFSSVQDYVNKWRTGSITGLSNVCVKVDSQTCFVDTNSEPGRRAQPSGDQYQTLDPTEMARRRRNLALPALPWLAGKSDWRFVSAAKIWRGLHGRDDWWSRGYIRKDQPEQESVNYPAQSNYGHRPNSYGSYGSYGGYKQPSRYGGMHSYNPYEFPQPQPKQRNQWDNLVFGGVDPDPNRPQSIATSTALPGAIPVAPGGETSVQGGGTTLNCFNVV